MERETRQTLKIRRSYVIVSLLIVCMIGMTAFIMYYQPLTYFSKRKTELSQVTMKTYTNKTYGFSFQYPSNLTAIVRSKSDLYKKQEPLPTNLQNIMKEYKDELTDSYEMELVFKLESLNEEVARISIIRGSQKKVAEVMDKRMENYPRKSNLIVQTYRMKKNPFQTLVFSSRKYSVVNPSINYEPISNSIMKSISLQL